MSIVSTVLHAFKLLIPALIPSWRFFDVIAPSPRIEISFLEFEGSTPQQWVEFRPHPAKVSFREMLFCMLWNPRRNETLFLVSCAEHLIERPERHFESEISKRIMNDCDKNFLTIESDAHYFQFRLLVIYKQDAQLKKKIVFHSSVYSLDLMGLIKSKEGQSI